MPKSSEEQYQKLSAKAAEKLGLPDGFATFSPFPFAGMNQQASRSAIDDKEWFYSENFIRIGDGNFRTLWDKGATLYTAPTGKKIVYYFFYNIGATNYAIVFLSDGAAVQVNSTTGATTTVSSVANTFYTGTQIPVCSQWGTLYLLIANNITPNSYWIWDGSLLYSPGSLGPGITITNGGSGYSSTPTVTAFGGSGSSVTAVATVSDGSVVSVQITNPGTGFLPGDIVQFAFSGGGSNNSAILEAVLATGTVASLQLVSGGAGYTAGSLTFTGGGGTGAAGTYTVAGGVVTSLTLTAAGSGYTGSPTIGFSTGGTGASALAILSAGSVASVTIVNGGTGFTSTPTLTIEGGSGSGATATASLTSGVITSVTVTAGGSGYTSDPAVIVETAINNAADATATLMPYGVSGSSIETYESRVWLAYPNQTGNQENGGTILVSATGSITDFATSDGGLTYVSTDPFLRYQYTNIKQSNGYLYPIGDSSVDVISNVQTSANSSGKAVSTTFNYQNTDPQVGTSWRDTLADFSRTILFANPLGVYGLYGGSVTKISGKMDSLFTHMVLPAAGGVTPCSAIANIYSQKVFLMLMTVTDVYTGLARNVLIGWDEKEWFVASQSSVLTFLGTQEVASNLTAWGTDGINLFPLFQTPSSALAKVFSTKLYGAQQLFVIKQAMSVYVKVQDLSTARSGVVFSTTTIDTEVGSYAVPNTISLPSGTPTTPPFAPLLATNTGDVYGVNLGLTMESTSPDFSLSNLGLGYTQTVGVFGSQNLTNIAGE